MAGGTDWEDTRNIYQGPRRFKERTISNEHNNWGEKPLEGTNSRMREAAEQRSELEDRIAKTAETEQHEENRIKRNEDSLMEKAMAPHSSTLACKIPWVEELGGLQSMELLRVYMIERLHFHFSPSCIVVATHSSVPAWRIPGILLLGCRLWVAQRPTWLKRLSSSSMDLLSISQM